MKPLGTIGSLLVTALVATLPSFAAATVATPTPAAAATAAPQTVPALRQWTAGSGSYTFTSTSRVVVDPAYAAQTTGDATTFAADLSALAGRTVAVVQGTPAAGDVALTLGGTDLPAEGYRMTVGTSITIQGSSSTGEFWGTRSVLQLLHQSPSISAGTAVDSPTKPERGLMIDQGRKFFTVPWIRQEIQEMSYLKMNYFHFHLSDTFGFRLESSTHPEITSTDHYTKQDITDLIALGRQYHVTIVPEIDMPGHMDAILAAHPELRLVDSSGNASSSFVDLTKPAARTLISDLINEYLPLFGSGYWHLGADEYITNYASYPQLLSYARASYGSSATAKDTYYGFINWADGLVRAGGRTMRIWNDGIKAGDGTITPNADITVDYWYNYGLTPQQLIAAGHTVANESWTPTYYVLGGAVPDTTWMYESWNPDLYQGGNTITDSSRNPGSVIHVWCDNPTAQTETQIAAGITYPLRDLAQMTWGSPKPASTYAAFVPIMDSIGHNPLWPSPVIPGDLAQNRPVTASSTETASFPAVNAVDGDPATRWSSLYTDPSWIQVDLGSAQTVNRVVLAWEAAYGKAFQIQISPDASTWTTLWSTTTGTGGTQTLTGFTGTGRYLRMYGTQRGTSYGYSLYEFEAFHDTGAPNVNGTHTVVTGGQALDDPAGSTATGTQLISWALHGGANQQWQFTQQSDGSYTLANGSSKLCADTGTGTAGAGTPVVQATCTGGSSQRWTVTALAGGGYTLASAGSGLLLGTASTANGALVTLQANTGSALQHWALA